MKRLAAISRTPSRVARVCLLWISSGEGFVFSCHKKQIILSVFGCEISVKILTLKQTENDTATRKALEQHGSKHGRSTQGERSQHERRDRVTWGKAPPFGDDLSLTYLFASPSEKKLHVCNKLYVMCIMTEYHMRSDNMSEEIRLLIAALKMSQISSCGAKRPGGL